MTEQKAHLCAICAWRADCNKKFSVSKDPNPHCPEFTRDVRVKDASTEKKSPKKAN